MNLVKTELEEEIDKPLRDAMKNLKDNWQGEARQDWRMVWKERALLYNETVLCVQNVKTSEMGKLQRSTAFRMMRLQRPLPCDSRAGGRWTTLKFYPGTVKEAWRRS